MTLSTQHLKIARPLGVAILALSLGACASYKEDFAKVNTRLDALDVEVQGAAQGAGCANQSLQQRNQPLDQIEGRVQRLETAPRRTPRG